ncbi:MAG TPA: sugar ABC transporter substrate-binding protein [Dermatophilaceae bacterium]|jgi:multiple sugar transport system substrate-binding protein
MRLNPALAATAVALSLTVSGCSSGSSSGAATKDGPVTLSYGVWDQNQVPALAKVVASFEKANPTIKVKIQVTPYEQYFTKLQAAAGGGSAPDVFWMNGPNFKLYASNGVLAPLSDQIKKDGLDTSVYPQALDDLYSLNGKQYGLPKDFDTIGLWYNKTLFDQAGVKYPDASWTWKDLQSAAAKLTNKSKGLYGLPAALEGQQNFYNTILQAGGQVLSADHKSSGYSDPATIEGLRFWTDLIKNGSSPSLQQMTDTLPLQWFESGKAAMFYGGSWNVTEFKKNEYTVDKVNVAPLPMGKKKAVVIHGLANVISAKSPNAEAAWKFVKYLGSKDAAAVEAETGTVIPAYNGTQQAWVAASPKYDLKVFLDAAAYSTPLPVSQNTAAWNTDETKYLTEAWAGREDVAAAAAQLAGAMNADLAKENK